MELLEVVKLWLIIINILTYIVYAVDKYKAVHHKWRISEKTLLLCAVAGGSVGALLAMYTVRHKTKHIKFVIGVPAILVVQVIMGYMVYILLYHHIIY